MGFNPSQQRAPAGSSGGGQWSAGGSSSAKKSTPTRVTPVKRAATGTTGTSRSLGPPRNAAAAAIQQDKQAQQLYHDMLGMSPADQGAFVRKLPPGQLEKLTGILYSSPTSDPSIVKARIVVANEMGSRGLDIHKYGALGRGVPTKSAHRRVTPAQHVAVATARARGQHRVQPVKAYATPKAHQNPGRRPV